MSERLFRFNTLEMKFIRIVCQDEKCGHVSEFPIQNLERFGPQSCGACHKEMFPSNKTRTLSILAQAFAAMNDASDNAKFEFTISIEDKKTDGN